MELEKSPFEQEVKNVMASGANPVNGYWIGRVLVGDSQTPWNIIKVKNYDIYRDYEKGYADVSSCVLVMDLGVWLKQVWPNRNNLKIQLKRIPLQESTSNTDNNSDFKTTTFRAVPSTDSMKTSEGQDLDALPQSDLEHKDIIDITFQLLDPVVEQARTITVGGTFRKTTVEDVLNGLITNAIQNQTSNNNNSTNISLDAVDVVKPDHQDQKEHIVIPPGTSLMALPNVIQSRVGVYSSGIGRFLQDNKWYVYPLFNTNRYNDVKKTFTLIKVPKMRLQGVERTYMVSGDLLTILATSNATYQDDTASKMMNTGNGRQFADASKFVDGFASVSDNKATSKRSENNFEFLSEDYGQGRNFIQKANDPITSNPYKHYSELAPVNGSIYTAIWDNANPSLLYPGMPGKVLYYQNTANNDSSNTTSQVKTLNAILIAVEISYQLNVNSLVADRHTCTTALHLFVKEASDIL